MLSENITTKSKALCIFAKHITLLNLVMEIVTGMVFAK